MGRPDLVTAPEDGAVLAVVDLELAKRQCHLDGTTDEDGFVGQTLIPAAFDRAELVTRRQLLVATWDLKLDFFPCVSGIWGSHQAAWRDWIELPKPPLIEVVSITYVDTAGATQTWASSNYLVDAPQGPRCARGRVSPAYGVIWPQTRYQLNAVTIRFRAGYVDDITAAAVDQEPNVPALLVQGMLMDIGTMFENRENYVGDTRITDIPTGRSQQIFESFRSYGSQS